MVANKTAAERFQKSTTLRPFSSFLFLCGYKLYGRRTAPEFVMSNDAQLGALRLPAGGFS